MENLELVWGLTAREKQFIQNFFSTCGNNREIAFANYLMDVKLYNYTHAKELISLFPTLFDLEDKSNLFVEAEVECQHDWYNDYDEQDMITCLQEDSKYIRCRKCGESRFVEVDCSLGGYII